MKKTVAILTGDIIKSRSTNPEQWLPALKKALNIFGKEPKAWEIFRGDSFQLIAKPEEAIAAALLIKTSIRECGHRLGARIAIGIGNQTYTSKKITESNGTAFQYSGECFESLKKETWALQSANKEINEIMKIMLGLADPIIDRWTPNVAGILKTALLNPASGQQELARILEIKQSNVSRSLSRGGYSGLAAMNEWYKSKINTL